MVGKSYGGWISIIILGGGLSALFSIGLLSHLLKLQASDINRNTTKPTYSASPKYISFKNQPKQTVTIQAVGDIIPGTNFPDRRLPQNKNQLIPQSVRKHLKKADILFGNLESSLTNHPYSAKDISRRQVFAFRSLCSSMH